MGKPFAGLIEWPQSVGLESNMESLDESVIDVESERSSIDESSNIELPANKLAAAPVPNNPSLLRRASLSSESSDIEDVFEPSKGEWLADWAACARLIMPAITTTTMIKKIVQPILPPIYLPDTAR